MLELNNLGYSYPDAAQPALQNINLQVRAGECLGLLGSNGAGKTTLLSLLSGVMQPQQGGIRWHGERSLGLVPQQLAFYGGLKVRENLELFADLHRLRGAERRARMELSIGCTDLGDKLQRRGEQLSGGEQRRLNFAIGVLQPAQLYLFDEATVGVDANSRQLLLSAVEQLVADGRSVIYTSHYLDEVERVAQRILLLHEGRIRLDLDKRQLLGNSHGLLLEWPHQPPAGLDELLVRLQLQAETLPRGLRVAELNGAQLLEVVAFIQAQDRLPCLLRFGRPSLEQLYLRLNGGQL
ncbi:ABC transporter ATP-binding protein [Pseudomonas borbori]